MTAQAETEASLYARAGIQDLADFYRTKFVSDAVLDPRYFRPVDRFDLRFARTMWVYDNVRRGSSVLDLGCGAGMLALLKRKQVSLVGIDVSPDCVTASLRNGYDEAYTAELKRLPIPDHYFDYVVSLDVLGHIPLPEKDAALTEIRRVLRPDGVTLHGVECSNRATHGRYDQMNTDELRRFVSIDGHVGLEEEEQHAERFLRFFKYVAWEPRYSLCLSSDEFLKQADKYGLPFDEDFLDYLRGLSFAERRAFDMAMGYVFNKISTLGLRLPKSGLYLLLKASNQPLGPFYNEHRDRRDLLRTEIAATAEKTVCLDRHPHATFDEGWYEADDLPPRARWMRREAHVRFRADGVSRIELDLTTHLPDLADCGLTVEIFLNAEPICAFTICRWGWIQLAIDLSERMRADHGFDLQIRTDRTWQPRTGGAVPRDDRELSISVCNLRIS